MAGTDAEQQLLGRVPRQLLIAGEWRDARHHALFPVEDPATEQTLCEVSDASPADGAQAIAAAARAQEQWAISPPAQRAEILRGAYERLIERTDELALLMTLEMGKALAESRAEIMYSAEFFRWFAGAADRIDGSYKVAAQGRSRVLVMRQPVGPCYLVTPWNFPCAMGARKIAPAIAAGCTMVVKPAEHTPLSMLALAELLTECGLPAGVLNVVPTTSPAQLTRAVMSDSRLRKLSFTGSTAVGRALLAQAADSVLSVSMELGGNAPFIVFDDADLDDAIEGAMVAKMRNIGEACTAANRFLVADPIAEEFGTRLAERMGQLRLGRGTSPQTDVGPLIDDDQRRRVATRVSEAVQGGARVMVGGRALDGPGYFYEPTVLIDVDPRAHVVTEEIFGPVAPISRFSSEDEAIALANDTPYGLVAYVYAKDVKRVLRVSESIEAGMVAVNQGLVSNPGAPFGGMKQSGIGREGGNEGLDEYLETKYVALGV